MKETMLISHKTPVKGTRLVCCKIKDDGSLTGFVTPVIIDLHQLAINRYMLYCNNGEQFDLSI